MKRVLVTGATGFIGQCTLPLLQAGGYDVHAVSSEERSRVRERHTDLHWHCADLLDPTAVDSLVAGIEPSHLLHLAWYAKPGAYWTSPENFRWLSASLGLIEAFARHGGQRIVVAGTCAEYDWAHGWCSEAVTPLRPSTAYGECKHALRSLLGARAGLAGLSWAWGRVFFLYGPYEYPSRLVASVIGSLLRGEQAHCSSGEQIRDFMHVADVAAAFVALLDSGVRDAVNIASGTPVTVKQIVQRIGALLGREQLLRLGARPTPTGEPPLLLADVRRLAGEVDWRPQFDLESGLVATIDWWRHNLDVHH